MTREIVTVNSGVLAELKDLGVNRDDIVAIHTAAVEQGLVRKQTFMEASLKDLSQVLEQYTEAYQRLQEAFTEKEVKRAKAEAQKTVSALVKLGFEKAALDTVSVEDKNKQKDKLHLRLCFTSDNDRYGGIHQRREIPYSKPVLDARMAKDQAQAAVLKCQERILEIKLALANIVREERSAKAALAMAALEQTDAGRAIIDKLRGLKPISA